jgi:hypothetical protein
MDLNWKVFKSNYGFVYGYTQNTLGAPDLFERITRIINWALGARSSPRAPRSLVKGPGGGRKEKGASLVTPQAGDSLGRARRGAIRAAPPVWTGLDFGSSLADRRSGTGRLRSHQGSLVLASQPAVLGIAFIVVVLVGSRSVYSSYQHVLL